MRQKNPKLTAKEAALVKALHTRKPDGTFYEIGEAAVIAGYSDKNPQQSGSQALSAVREKMPQVLDRHGLTADALVDKYLVPLLEAEETIFAQKDGLFTDERTVEDNGTRKAALEMTMKIGGHYEAYRAQAEENKSDGPVSITVIIQDVSRPNPHTTTAQADRVQ